MRLIDAEHLKRWILARWEKTDPTSEYPLRAIDIIDQIDREDTIEAKPVRHGKWTRDYESSWGDSRFMCSVCHCKESVPTCNGEPSIWDYCPNCGAKMDEVNDDK